ncbi:MAG: hypothetical protein ABH854_02870 [Candidatus Diapherotrites archaeon]|nr:hypothetical protein [Candidatus Micrarchaeota archaeon]MBU1939636.1 hypothetical protein [Candidatus Micrarchaeota archaeon]
MPPLIGKVDVLAKSGQIKSEMGQLYKWKQTLSAEDAVSYLKRFSVLFVQAAQYPGRSPENTCNGIFSALQEFASVCPREMRGFVGGEHGVVALARKALSIREWGGTDAMRAYFFHNAVHWGGLRSA